jgi:hypothetical protein
VREEVESIVEVEDVRIVGSRMSRKRGVSEEMDVERRVRVRVLLRLLLLPVLSLTDRELLRQRDPTLCFPSSSG